MALSLPPRGRCPATPSRASASFDSLTASAWHGTVISLLDSTINRRDLCALEKRSSFRGRIQVRALLEDVMTLGSTVMKAEEMFKKYDAAREDGGLSQEEVFTLLNSEDYKDWITELVGDGAFIERSEKDIRALFKKVDSDKSGALSRTEFVMLWLALVRERTKASPKLLALAFCRFLDSNKDGQISINELKRFLGLLGPFGAGLTIIPMSDKMGFDYERHFK